MLWAGRSRGCAVWGVTRTRSVGTIPISLDPGKKFRALSLDVLVGYLDRLAAHKPPQQKHFQALLSVPFLVVCVKWS